jgi:broad specificity phosphatase PhoE
VADGLVRHGETEWSRSGQHTGHSDIPLTWRGEEQARRLGEKLGGRRFARVFTSPLARARDTAALAGYGEQAEPLDDLREWDYGSYEGRTTVEIREEIPGWTPWTHGFPDGETLEAFGQRADRVIAEIRAVGGEVLVFAHGHLLRVLAARWCELPPSEACRLMLDTATLSVLGDHHDLWCVRHWNMSS